MGKLDGKVAVITGGTRGLGLATARTYGREGATVVVSSRSTEAVERAVAELAAAGIRASGLPCDVADLRQVETLAEYAIAIHGRIDVWVNNAGLSAPYGPTAQIEPAAFLESTRTIVLGTYHGSLVALRHFLPRKAGKLINIFGRGDRQPVAYQNAYAAGKAWVRSFTLALAEENRGTGVGIFGYNPGMMRTDLLLRVEAVAGHEWRLRSFPTVLRMWSTPPEVPAERLVWLASSATDGRTGLTLRGMSPFSMLSGAIGEGIRRVLGRPAPPIHLDIRSVPAALEMPIGFRGELSGGPQTH